MFSYILPYKSRNVANYAISKRSMYGVLTYISPIFVVNVGKYKHWVSGIHEGCSKFFHLENAIFAKKFFLSPNFRELHVYLSRYMLAKIFKKNMDVWYPQIVPGVWSLVTLHSAAAALKHLPSALRCWSLLTFIGQFWHNKSTVEAT